MRCENLMSIMASLVIAGFWLMPAAKADNWNELTKLTFSAPVAIPGRVLPAGSYWFELLNLQSDRDVVAIYSADWSQYYGAVMTIPKLREQHIGRTEIRFAERPHSQPEALMEWFYPGRAAGHEFIYPERQEVKLNRDRKQDIYVPALNSRPPAS